MSSINQFPWQDEIMRCLGAAEGALSIDQIAADTSIEGAHSDELREGIALNVDHLVHLGLADYADGRPGPTESTSHDVLFHRTVKLTPAGKAAVDRLP